MKTVVAGAVIVTVLASGGVANGGSKATVSVYAAASLADAFPKIAPGAKYSFAGSNTLAAQIRQGAPADVFASANMTLPAQLYRDELCSRPVVFTRNGLAVIVPKSNPAGIRSVYDLRKHGIRLVVASPTVPVGSYTLQVLRKMKLTSALANVVSRETDVREVLAKIALGEGDAGFVYSTDAKTVPGKVRTLEIPAWAQPKVQYGICVVSASSNKAAARAFVKRVTGRTGQKILIRHGFLPRVKPKARH
ncbi:MAG TPA: molybdate ABC transporter substrate-binding protein [Gaiellaceae bacterium]|jgi:molybdate transport system substrate-binding protein|nr:molybdate ABC transporter substrate-binding protein [Gaiellaceae bacterium]